VTAPADQTAALVPAGTPVHAAARAADMLACYALMLGFDSGPDLPFDAALVRDADISWISVNSSKPGRPPAKSVVVHSTNAWAGAHLEDEPDAVLRHLLAEFARVTGADAGKLAHRDLHRWRFANCGSRPGPTHAVDAGRRLAACGDWFVRGRVEAAFRSAADLVVSLRRLGTVG
ncbi:MAG: hypothetical protein R3176_05245, partial [Woeseiaceae bacterium]|nr:hypothetical protein [Woeseiaceae bacterium]